VRNAILPLIQKQNVGGGVAIARVKGRGSRMDGALTATGRRILIQIAFCVVAQGKCRFIGARGG